MAVLPRQFPRRARLQFANFVCDLRLCVVTVAYERVQDSPVSRENPPRQPCRQPPCPITNPVLRPVFMLCWTTPPLSGALCCGPLVGHLPISFFVIPQCLVRPIPLQASMHVVPAIGVTRVRRFVPLVGNKDLRQNDDGQKDVQHRDVGQKSPAVLAGPAPSREFMLMSGEETRDPVPCATAVQWAGHR